MTLHLLTNLELNIFQKKLKKLISIENIKTNTYRIQANDSIMWGCFCIGFVGFRLKRKSFLVYIIYFLEITMKRMKK